MWDKPPENPGSKILIERTSAQSRTFLGPAPPVDPVSANQKFDPGFSGTSGICDCRARRCPRSSQSQVAFFGIESSPSFVREPEGNGVAERFIRTLKENVLWVRSFDTIEEFRLALLEFKRTYNEHWMLERYDYRSPAQVRRDLVGLDAAA